MAGSIIFDLMLWGAIKLFTPKKKKVQIEEGDVPLWPLAFDHVNRAQRKNRDMKYEEPDSTGSDPYFDGGPNW